MDGSAADEVTADELLAHGAWLRRLARALVGEGGADDVVQETYEVALAQPPAKAGPLRPWLGGVARNLARMTARSGARRAQREEAVEAPVAAPSPEELVARAQVQERVARMVLELDEPLRATLMLRYYEGLSAADIARAQGVPAGTVRWRLKQALDQVRSRLDDEHRGDRKAWVALVAPLAPALPIPPAAPAAGTKFLLGGLAVKTGTKIAALVAVLLALVVGSRYAGLWGTRGAKPTAAVAAHDAGHAPTPPPPVAGGAPAAAPAPAERVPAFRDDDPKGTLRLEGVVVDEAEHGVAGARVAIDASPPIVVETDSDGSFAFDGLIARDYRVEATTGERYAGPARLRLTDKTEPVTLRLRQGGVVEVVVTDRAGGAAVAGAEVELRASLGWRGITGADGVAVLRGVGETWAPLAVTARGFAPAAVMLSTTGLPGTPARVAVALGRGAAVSGRVRDDAGKPVAGARVIATPAAEPFPVSDPRRDGVLTGADGTFTLPAVAAGSFRLTASDAVHAAATSTPIVLDGVHPRGGFELVLTAGAVVRGVVTDGAGQPVAAAEVRVVSAGHVEWRARRQAFTDEQGHFTIAGLPRRAVEVVAWHPQGASAIAAADLAATREQEVKLVLDVTGAIAGQVVDPAGEPVGDAQVLAEPEYGGGVADRAMWQVRGVQEAVSDAGGGFRFAGLPAGTYRVRVARPAASEAALWQGAGVRARPGDAPLRLVLAADGSVAGKVTFADGTVPAAFAVEINGGHAVPVASKDGAFAVPAPSGAVIVNLTGPGFVPKRVDAQVEDGERAELGTITVEAGRSVSGRVLDAAGAPVAGATVAAGALLSGGGAELYIEGESIKARSTVTDADGRYVLSGYGRHVLTVVGGKDGVGRSASVTVPRGPDSAVVDLVLQTVGGVDGKLTRDGQPLPDTVIIANPIGATASNFFVVTGPDGSFAFDALTAGPYFVYPMLGAGGNRAKDMVLRSFEVSAGARTKLDLDASSGKGKLTVKVTTDAGAPVPLAQLIVVQAVVDAPTMEALRDGSFLPPDLRRGGTVMMHIRAAMGAPAVIEQMRPGTYSACAIPLSDPSRAREADDLPMKCGQAKVGDAPASVEIVVPVAWTLPPKAP